MFTIAIEIVNGNKVNYTRDKLSTCIELYIVNCI